MHALTDPVKLGSGRVCMCGGSQVRLAHAMSIEGVITRANLSSREHLVGRGADLRNNFRKDQVCLIFCGTEPLPSTTTGKAKQEVAQ